MANEKFRGVVNDSDEAAKNIHRYNAEISTEEGEELALLMPYARSWYAIKLENGAYMFGPSKFIGYVNNDAKAYMNHKGADGRKKEARLQSISTLIEAGHPDYFDLSKTLSKFLGSFGHSTTRPPFP